jgi:Flp pilus assembly protein TadD
LEQRQRTKPEENVLLKLSDLYSRSGEAERAEALLKARLAEEPGDVAARVALGTHYLQKKQNDLALREYQRVAADAPTSIIALNNIAWLLQQQGELPKAREAAERAVALAPQNASVADTLGWVVLAQGDVATALRYLKPASASSPDPEIQYHLAVALKKAGNNGDAKTVLEGILGGEAPFASRADAQMLLQELKRG